MTSPGHLPPAPAPSLDPGEVRSLTVMNRSGDSTLTWTEKNDDLMRGVIEKKIAEGFAFFIVRKRLKGLLSDRKIRITDAAQAMASRKLVMADEDLASVISDGGVRLVPTPEREAPLADGDAVLSRDPEEISQAQSLAVAPMAGG